MLGRYLLSKRNSEITAGLEISSKAVKGPFKKTRYLLSKRTSEITAGLEISSKAAKGLFKKTLLMWFYLL
jgi:ribosome-associated toxin RatA of RatAB toxin-antitoxin module